MASPPPSGIYVPVPTFFSSSGSPDEFPATPSVDISTQSSYSLYLAKAGIKGLVILGTTGEAVYLHPRDRKQLISSARDALKQGGFENYPLIAGTATQSIEETVEQLVEAKESGAQWGLCLAPGYNATATTQEGIIKWFTAVADQSPIPIMIYHFPGVSNMLKITTATFVTLARHSNIVGCKLSHGDVSHHIQIAANPSIDASKFHVFTGFGQQLWPVVAAGAAGAIDGSAGFFPKSLVRLYSLSTKDQVTESEVKERRQLQFKVSSMEEIVIKFGIVGIKEAISRLRGFGDKNGTRLPLHGGLPGGEGEWENWKQIMDAMEEVENSL